MKRTFPASRILPTRSLPPNRVNRRVSKRLSRQLEKGTQGIRARAKLHPGARVRLADRPVLVVRGTLG